jgi:hypothetical protein
MQAAPRTVNAPIAEQREEKAALGLCDAGAESFNSVQLTGFLDQDPEFKSLNTCYTFSKLDSDKLPVFVAANGAKIYHNGARWAVASAGAQQVCTVSASALLLQYLF